jgi:hypothetical protein
MYTTTTTITTDRERERSVNYFLSHDIIPAVLVVVLGLKWKEPLKYNCVAPPVSSLSTLQIYIPLSSKTTMDVRLLIDWTKGQRRRRKKWNIHFYTKLFFFGAFFTARKREREKKGKICHVGNVAVIKMFSPPAG